MAAAPAAKSAEGNAHSVALFSIDARRSGLVQHGVSRPARRRSDCPSPIQHPGCRETLIVKQNHGFLNVYSEPGHGTTFKLYLPRHGGAAKQAAESTTTKDTGGHEVILLAEDEQSILQMTKKMLERQGYTVIAASTPGEAIRMAREHDAEIHLLLTDVVMPEMNGRDLAKNLLSLYPRMKRLFMSGYTADVIAHHGVLDKGVNFIQKPFSGKELAAKVREALEG
jgi:CheY-like chemotaxis protein